MNAFELIEKLKLKVEGDLPFSTRMAIMGSRGWKKHLLYGAPFDYEPFRKTKEKSKP